MGDLCCMGDAFFIKASDSETLDDVVRYYRASVRSYLGLARVLPVEEKVVLMYNAALTCQEYIDHLRPFDGVEGVISSIRNSLETLCLNGMKIAAGELKGLYNLLLSENYDEQGELILARKHLKAAKRLIPRGSEDFRTVQQLETKLIPKG